MPTLWFVMPAHGRLPLAQICMRQLRRTCDALTENGIEATAVVIADDDNLACARSLGFATVRRDNQFVSRKFNDGFQVACERPIGRNHDVLLGHGEYEVTGRREYRGHPPGSVFHALIEPGPENRAVARRDIRLLRRLRPSVAPDAWKLPGHIGEADYVMPIGSDDWIDWRIIPDVLPEPDEVVGFQHISFVNEDASEMAKTFLNYAGGCGMRIYPRQLLEPLGFRPAEEDRYRGCDTSILTNVRLAHPTVKVMHVATDPRQIVDWKTPGEQLNGYSQVARRHFRDSDMSEPFSDLAGVFPDEALEEMEAHYAASVFNNRGREALIS